LFRKKKPASDEPVRRIARASNDLHANSAFQGQTEIVPRQWNPHSGIQGNPRTRVGNHWRTWFFRPHWVRREHKRQGPFPYLSSCPTIAQQQPGNHAQAWVRRILISRRSRPTDVTQSCWFEVLIRARSGLSDKFGLLVEFTTKAFGRSRARRVILGIRSGRRWKGNTKAIAHERSSLFRRLGHICPTIWAHCPLPTTPPSFPDRQARPLY
jgi:hypothetical protein